MDTAVITTEGLGKSYIIGHKQQESYTTLRDVMANTAKHWWSRLQNPHYHTHEEIEEFWALKNVNFEIKQGDRVGIIGRNGAGKSTLLKILSRITEPTTGKAKINGRVASLLEVGTGFHPELTGRENIFLNGAILGMSRAEIRKKFDEIVDFAEVEKFLDTPVKRYSSGMYVRLAFAVAAHLEPEILIVDEVLAVGDVSFQKKCLGKMGEVSKEGRTVLFVSHNMAAVQQLCDNAILLESGSLKKKGVVNAVVDEYLLNLPKDFDKKNLYSITRRGTLGQNARITGCRLLDSTEKITNTFKFGESFIVEIECVGIKPLSKLQFVVGINSTFDQRITTILSNDGEDSFNLKPNEKKRGILRIKNLCLLPGTYYLTLSVRDTTAGYDQLVNVRHFDVEPARADNIIDDYIVPYGLIHIPNPDWTISC